MSGVPLDQAGIVGVLVFLILKEVFSFVRARNGRGNGDGRAVRQIQQLWERKELEESMDKIATGVEELTRLTKDQTLILQRLMDKIEMLPFRSRYEARDGRREAGNG